MNFLLKVTIPIQAGNAMVRDPKFGKKLDEIMKDIRAKEAFFAVNGGQRTMYILVEVSDASRLPAIVEPFWLAFEASIECTPVLTAKDFQKAAPDIERAAKKY